MTVVNDLAKRSKDSAAMLPYLEKVAVIIGGESEVKEASVKYLPMMPKEQKPQYEFRLSVAKFTNIYRDVVESLAAKPFEKEVSLLGESVPESLTEFSEDVDGDGNNLTVFAATLFFNGINDAISWVLIDYPNATVRTVAEAKQAGIRPYWTNILAINVLDAKTARIGGESVLSYVRMMEPGDKRDDDKIRIFEREGSVVKWSVHIRDTKVNDNWLLEDEGVLTIGEIPMVPFITGRRDGKRFFFRPPLQDAVNLQMTLYRQESALEYAKVMTAFPMLSASGVVPKKDAAGNAEPIMVGPQTVLYAPQTGDGKVGNWAYVEPAGSSLTFLQGDVKETKQDLRELGKQPLTAQAGLTVITTAYAAGKSKSAVAAWGLALKDALENAMVITCQWLKIDHDPEVYVYDDYDTFSAEDFTSVISMRENGDISRETVWREAKRRAILSAEFNDDKEAAALLKETPGDGSEEFTTPKPKEITK